MSDKFYRTSIGGKMYFLHRTSVSTIVGAGSSDFSPIYVSLGHDFAIVITAQMI